VDNGVKIPLGEKVHPWGQPSEPSEQLMLLKTGLTPTDHPISESERRVVVVACHSQFFKLLFICTQFQKHRLEVQGFLSTFVPGVDAGITIYCDFRQFSAFLSFFTKNTVKIQLFKKIQ
jgi:hypothetical protein